MKRWLFVDFTETVRGKKVADVYKILADLEGWPDWAGTILDTKWNETPGWREGVKFGFKVGQGKVGVWMNVTAYTVQENDELGWVMKIPGLLYVYHNFTFRQVGDDVEVGTTECFEGPLGFVLSLLAGRAIKKGDGDWLRDLRVRAERG